MPSQTSERCRHQWQPYADAKRIWQVCVKCGTESHGTSHTNQLAATIAYVCRDAGE
jgi:hypothetical protein